MSAACLLCGSDGVPRFEVNSYTIHRCADCDFEFVHPLPTPDAIARVYASGYFQGDGHGYEDYFERERRTNQHKAKKRLERLSELGLKPGSRLLDLGCADGTFVEAALARGFDAYGIEVSEEALSRLPPELRRRVFPSLAAASIERYDAVTLWDVLEHLPAPVAALQGALALTTPTALFGVVVPVIENINARFWPRSWDQYKPPEHLWFFSRRSLRALLGREIGPIVFEETAWKREARFCDGAFPSAPAAVRPLRALEAAVVRSLLALRLAPESWTEDSVAMYARRR